MDHNSEKKPPVEVNHYQDQYWNDLPAIRAYMCESATGNKDLWWIQYFKKRYATTPFPHALIIGCGNGRIEREMYDEGIAEQFDAFDCSEQYIAEAKSQQGSRPITYTLSSFKEFFPTRNYDLIVNVAALHHVDNLDDLLEKLSHSLSPEGLFVNWDYVGPNRNQYTDEHLKIIEDTNSNLPDRFRTKHQLRHDIEVFLKGDITEAIHAAEILPTFTKYYDIIERHDLGGGVAYQILWNNIAEFQKGDKESQIILQQLIDKDKLLTQKRSIPSLFAFFIGRSSKHSNYLQKQISYFYSYRMREYEPYEKKCINGKKTLLEKLKTFCSRSSQDNKLP